MCVLVRVIQTCVACVACTVRRCEMCCWYVLYLFVCCACVCVCLCVVGFKQIGLYAVFAMYCVMLCGLFAVCVLLCGACVRVCSWYTYVFVWFVCDLVCDVVCKRVLIVLCVCDVFVCVA